MIDDICRDFHAKLIRTKVGEVHVAEELKKLKALIGGEGNGGVIFPKVGFNRDSLTGAAILLEYLAASKKKLSELIEELPHYEMVKTKVECRSTEEANDFVDKVKHIFRGEDLILTEGVKVVLKDGWIHVRPSNTEPIIRIIAEASNRQAVEDIVSRTLI
jgi:phosphomannomutase